mmetsp:Transcript_9165/g.13680  ORF Transcript_9165/g.13680 Transcript_9165/m.13680 type:complete len:249 (+) Transcript_9165:1006-1752(+)
MPCPPALACCTARLPSAQWNQAMFLEAGKFEMPAISSLRATSALPYFCSSLAQPIHEAEWYLLSEMALLNSRRMAATCRSRLAVASSRSAPRSLRSSSRARSASWSPSIATLSLRARTVRCHSCCSSTRCSNTAHDCTKPASPMAAADSKPSLYMARTVSMFSLLRPPFCTCSSMAIRRIRVEPGKRCKACWIRRCASSGWPWRFSSTAHEWKQCTERLPDTSNARRNSSLALVALPQRRSLSSWPQL